jgi:hypothetical protein
VIHDAVRSLSRTDCLLNEVSVVQALSLSSDLFEDMSSCDTDEYKIGTRNTALVMVGLWPIGIPVLYGALLFMSRNAIRSGRSTALSRATTFLWGDYKPYGFWWEPVEMCRKLTLCGWVLLIGEESEQARVVVALLVSIGFLAFHVAIKPLARYAALVLLPSSSADIGSHLKVVPCLQS